MSTWVNTMQFKNVRFCRNICSWRSGFQTNKKLLIPSFCWAVGIIEDLVVAWGHIHIHSQNTYQEGKGNCTEIHPKVPPLCWCNSRSSHGKAFLSVEEERKIIANLMYLLQTPKLRAILLCLVHWPAGGQFQTTQKICKCKGGAVSSPKGPLFSSPGSLVRQGNSPFEGLEGPQNGWGLVILP